MIQRILLVQLLCSMPISLSAEERDVIIESCSIFDPRTKSLLPNHSVLIQNGKISAVAPASEIKELPSNLIKIDGGGKYLLPGLIDAHVHLVHILDFAHLTGDEVLPLYLAAGVTAIRSTGDEIVAATLVARNAVSHPETSPRVFTCSPLLDSDPPIHRDIGRAVTSPDQVAPLLDDLLPWNISSVKIYARTERPIGRVIIDEGHKRNLFVTAHLGAYRAQDAVADGVDCLEHITSIYKDLSSDEIEALSDVLPSDSKQIELVRLLAEKGTMVVPTLTVFRNMIHLPDSPEISGHQDNELAPQRLRDFWPIYLQRTGCPQGGLLEQRKNLFSRYRKLTGLLHLAGVPILCGTDSPEPQVTPGFSLHQELELLVESGLSPAESLHSATLQNARAIRMQDRLGSIETGKEADLVLLAENPLEDIRNTRRIELVIRAGRIILPAELLQKYRNPKD